jgi:hypothetical protein
MELRDRDHRVDFREVVVEEVEVAVEEQDRK